MNNPPVKPQAIDPKTALSVLKFIWKYAKAPYARLAARKAWAEQKEIPAMTREMTAVEEDL